MIQTSIHLAIKKAIKIRPSDEYHFSIAGNPVSMQADCRESHSVGSIPVSSSIPTYLHYLSNFTWQRYINHAWIHHAVTE